MYVHTYVPEVKGQYILNWPHITDFKTLEHKFKASQKRGYDRRHRVRELPVLPKQLPVLVETQGRQVPGEVVQPAGTPRSYLVETPTGEVRRNRSHIRPRVEQEMSGSNPSERSAENIDQPRMISTCSRTGTGIHPPDRLSQSTEEGRCGDCGQLYCACMYYVIE